MKLNPLLLCLTILLATSAASARTILVKMIDDPVIKRMRIEKVASETLSAKRQGSFNSVSLACRNAPLASSMMSSNIPTTGDLRLDLILNLGAKLFEIIKANGPLVTATTKTANALPYGISCWNQLENWSMPRSETYRITYENLYGMTMVDLEYRLVYSYGGRIGNVGRYLSNATIQYKKLDAKWGTVVDANVEIPQVVNVGSRENPIAGMQITLNWTVTTRPISLRKIVNSATYFIAGDGRRTTLLD